jgi:hypothetical protein
VFSLQRTILSVMLFQRSLSGLVQDVRETGNLDSMFNAIRVDRAVMSCSTFEDRIARAELMGDKRFFHRLRNALKGPTQKHWQRSGQPEWPLELRHDGMAAPHHPQ